MLNFSLKNGNLIFNNKELPIIIENEKVYFSLSRQVQKEYDEAIVEYFDNNDFARLFAKISPSELDDSNIGTMVSFLKNVDKTSKELKSIIEKYADQYFLVFAVRNEFKDENFKVFCLNQKIGSVPEIEAHLYNEAPQWFSGYEIEILPLTNAEDFINKIRE